MRATDTELTRPPEVPVIVTVEVPAGAVLVALSVKLIVEPPPALQEAMTPVGRLESASETLPVKPFAGISAIVVVAPDPPALIARLLGVAVSEKFGEDEEAFTVRLMLAVWTSAPDMPVIVMVPVPVAAVLLAVSVNALLLVVEAGLNDAVTPLGNPEADKETVPVNPFCGVTLMVLPPEPPCVTVTLEGAADKVKLGAGLTVKLRVVVFVSVPEMPVIVTTTVPVAAVLPAVRLSELVVAVVAGLKVAVTPDGKPDADKLTLPVNPFCGVTVMVLGLPVAPCMSVKLAGDAPSVKFGDAAAVTVSEIVVVWVSAPEMPVTVTVEVPVAAVALAVRVRVLVVVALAGLNDAVTPLGKPDADKATLPVNPF